MSGFGSLEVLQQSRLESSPVGEESTGSSEDFNFWLFNNSRVFSGLANQSSMKRSEVTFNA